MQIKKQSFVCIIFSSLLETLIDFPKQLIAAVNGPAVGIGVTTLGVMDVVYASDSVSNSVS